MKSKREKFLKRTKEKMVEELTSRDMFLARVSRTIEDLDDVLNILGERLEDMFRLYYPEIESKDKETYSKLIENFDPKNINMKELSKFFGSGKANEIANKIKNAKNVEDDDLFKCSELAQEINRIYKLRESLEKYEKELCDKLCPNLAHVAGPSLAAKMIAHVGSIKKLAMLPASTLQVIGAEKALFKHLKNKRVKPPKHGLIFQHPRISTAPKKIRGRVARTLASKLATCAKADAFTGNFIAKEILENFNSRCKKLMDDYKENKDKKKKPKTK